MPDLKLSIIQLHITDKITVLEYIFYMVNHYMLLNTEYWMSWMPNELLDYIKRCSVFSDKKKKILK